MSKKIILLCALFCINAIFAEQQQLTPQETTIYDEFMKKCEQNKQLPIDEINQFLTEKKVSIQDLYEILNKKQSILNQAGLSILNQEGGREIYTSYIMSQASSNSNDQAQAEMAASKLDQKLGIAFLMSALGFFAASPILAAGLAIKQYIAPSPMQKIISSGLVGSSALIASYAPTVYGIDFIATKLSNLYESITHKKRNAQNKFQAIMNELNKITTLMTYLKSLYPELNK